MITHRKWRHRLDASVSSLSTSNCYGIQVLVWVQTLVGAQMHKLIWAVAVHIPISWLFLPDIWHIHVYIYHNSRYYTLTLSTLGKIFSRHFDFLFLFFPGNRIWNFMQIVSNLHEMLNPVSWEKYQFVVCWISQEQNCKGDHSIKTVGLKGQSLLPLKAKSEEIHFQKRWCAPLFGWG